MRGGQDSPGGTPLPHSRDLASRGQARPRVGSPTHVGNSNNTTFILFTTLSLCVVIYVYSVHTILSYQHAGVRPVPRGGPAAQGGRGARGALAHRGGARGRVAGGPRDPKGAAENAGAADGIINYGRCTGHDTHTI